MACNFGSNLLIHVYTGIYQSIYIPLTNYLKAVNELAHKHILNN